MVQMIRENRGFHIHLHNDLLARAGNRLFHITCVVMASAAKGAIRWRSRSLADAIWAQGRAARVWSCRKAVGRCRSV